MNNTQHRFAHTALALALTLAIAACSHNPPPPASTTPAAATPAIPKGEVTGHAITHTPASA